MTTKIMNTLNEIPEEGRSADELMVKAADEIEQLEAKYYDLIYAVSQKWPNETRHETALRYIRQAETITNEPALARNSHCSDPSGSLLDECLEMLAEVLESTVDASTYPDGQNLDYKLRARIAVVLTKAENSPVHSSEE